MSEDNNNPKKEENQKDQQEKPKVSLKKKCLASIDLFQFMPVPKTEMVSSQRSLYGSIIMINCFLGYFLFTFVAFVTNNSPTVNKYEQVMAKQNITLPEIAFGFFFGDPFSKTINDPSIFSFQMQQVTKYQDVTKSDVKATVPLLDCNPDWVPASNFTILCPSIPVNMSGALYQTEQFIYPRIQVTYCQPGGNVTCKDDHTISQTAAGGRILLYIKDSSPNFDLTTADSVDTVPYSTFQYFLIPSLYPRTEIYFQLSTYTIKPDFFRRWQNQVKQFLTINKIDTWMTNVSVYSEANGYSIGFRTELSESISILTYQTIFDMISKVGAFWSVLFAAFAAYFLVYNQKTFYEENKQWEDFGQQIGVKKAQGMFNMTEEAPHSKVNDSLVFEMTEVHQQSNTQNEENNAL